MPSVHLGKTHLLNQSDKADFDNIGFDVIHQVFFVNELVLECDGFRKEEFFVKVSRTFDNFYDYYDYLDGKIYDNSCYYQCDFSTIKKKIDKSKMSERNSFIEETIDNFIIEPTDEEKCQYNEGKKRKEEVKKWVELFVSCNSFTKLKKTVNLYNKSELSLEHNVDLTFFFWQYIFYDINDENRFEVIMKYMSTGCYPEYKMIRPLCHIYDASSVMEKYNYSLGSKQTIYKYKRRLKKYIESMKECLNIENETEVYFDEKTHYYCERDLFGVKRFFETFDELLKYRGNDLTNADLTKDIKLIYDFSKCKTNENTKLPIGNSDDLDYVIKKKYLDGKFRVLQAWYNKNKNRVKYYSHEFDYFFDFVAFLKGDLSNADLLLCDGLKNLRDISKLDFNDAKLTSSICDKFGIKYKKYGIDFKKIESFALTEEYESDSEIVLCSSRELLFSKNDGTLIMQGYDNTKERVYYISDLHLMHKLQHYGAKSESDVLYVLHTIVDSIVRETGSVLLIGGDIASDFEVFELFIIMLRDELKRKRVYTSVIIVLGNHELWEFPKLKFDEIVKKYEKLISDCGMYILQNDIIYQDSFRGMNRINQAELDALSEKEIREMLRDARLILFGGLGFSGYNNAFNADNGIYRKTISRDEEIEETKCFEKLYNKVVSILPDKRIIVFTHTPMDCWNKEINYHKNYVYVSGHTHRNEFNDDGEIRIYADNQIGYANNSAHLKWFDVDNEYDYFGDYEDGIYKINADDYKRFHHGKNIMITFNREINILYMLKKKGYYCFIHQSQGGSLTILNGGALKRLDKNDIEYYYENMDTVISSIKTPLDKYTSIQEKIASEIRLLGGCGVIHGCIVDIDWYNHIYVNPVDMKITGYWALDIINKKIYPDVPTLLEVECPSMYERYTKLLKDGSKALPMISNGTKIETSLLPQIYLNTDIYRASREIKKMQKLSSNILTTWLEVDNESKMLKLEKE